MLLERDKYIHWHRCHESSRVVSDIFWTHPDSLKLLNAFSNVLLMDNTYKTNKYRLPLLEIVGVTSTGLTFSAAFVLMSTECQNNFTWVLQKLRGLFFKGDVYPTIIISDRDLALMNAIEVVFPKATNLLCRFHINKNVKAKCKMLVHPREACDVVMKEWTTVIDCSDCEAFSKCVENFESVYLPWPIFLEYVQKTWIKAHKEKFVSAWTNKVMDMGNTTSNRYVVIFKICLYVNENFFISINYVCYMQG